MKGAGEGEGRGGKESNCRTCFCCLDRHRGMVRGPIPNEERRNKRGKKAAVPLHLLPFWSRRVRRTQQWHKERKNKKKRKKKNEKMLPYT